jgi:hypothetical protein
LQDKASKSVLSPDQSRRPPRHDEGWQAANRKGRAAMTRKTYCGNLLWQSSLTLLVPSRIAFMAEHLFYRILYKRRDFASLLGI